MKLFFAVVFVLVGIVSNAQTTIKLIIVKSDVKIDEVDIFDLSQKEYYRADYADTLTFNFKKKSIDCYNIRYHKGEEQFKQQIWLNEGQVTLKVKISNKQLVIDSVLNSPFYYDYMSYVKQRSILFSTKNPDLNNFLLNKIEKYSDSPFSLWVASDYITNNQNNKLALLKLKKEYSDILLKHNWFILYQLTIPRVETILNDSKLRITSYKLIDNGVKLDSLQLTQKDFIIIDFWFLACAPCVADHKIINQYYKSMQNRNIQFISVSTDKDLKSWRKYLDKNNYLWPNYTEEEGNKMTKYLNISIFPTYIAIDKSGSIVSYFNSFSKIVEEFHLKL